MQLTEKIIESALAPVKKSAQFYIGFSGGLDSHVLLQLCTKISFCQNKITAVYVDHGLQAESGEWAAHCQAVAEQLAVNFLAIKVNATAKKRQSPEEAARDARYLAFKNLIGETDVLLLAQHQEDQLETVLLQLFRGAGLPGLSGMPQLIPFAGGQLVRPLLAVDKQSLLDYANQQQLVWVDDPSNKINTFDRNFLRNEIIPALKQRWSALEKTVSRSAEHCANAQNFVDAEARTKFSECYDLSDQAIVISQLERYDDFLQKLILRYWFKHQGLRMPSQGFIDRILKQVVAASLDADPVLLGQGREIRRFRDKLYCLKQREVVDLHKQFCWCDISQVLSLSGAGDLELVPSDSGVLLSDLDCAKVTVKFRQGGEKISLPGREGRHQLKKLFQEAGIPPWQRQFIPLVYIGDELLAVGENWISSCYFSQKKGACVRFKWKKLK